MTNEYKTRPRRYVYRTKYRKRLGKGKPLARQEYGAYQIECNPRNVKLDAEAREWYIKLNMGHPDDARTVVWTEVIEMAIMVGEPAPVKGKRFQAVIGEDGRIKRKMMVIEKRPDVSEMFDRLESRYCELHNVDKVSSAHAWVWAFSEFIRWAKAEYQREEA